MRSRAEVIERIRACRKLADPARNTNEHERSAARVAAERLMREHRVTEEEIGTPGNIKKTPKALVNDAASALGELLRRSKIKRGWSTEDQP